jgi:hypothetical protein
MYGNVNLDLAGMQPVQGHGVLKTPCEMIELVGVER